MLSVNVTLDELYLLLPNILVGLVFPAKLEILILEYWIIN